MFDAIRAVHPTTPILILGGHTHIRDCGELVPVLCDDNILMIV